MANWSVITFNFDIFDPLTPPLEAALSGLELAEAFLEALLDLIKPFMLDLLNPLKAIIAALLAAVRAIVNQIRSTGIAILLVHPDFSQPDFSATLNSVSGAYPGFESKVVAKFYDTVDVFRPQYPPGSSVAMLIFYLGADSPGDLIGLIYALLSLIKHPIQLSSLPAPVDVKAGPVNQSGDAISQFRNLFDSDLDQAVQLEWRMPQGPSGSGLAGFIGQISAFYNSFRFPNFIIERHGPFPQDDGDDQLSQQGETILIDTNSTTLGTNVDTLTERYGFPKVNSKVAVREEDGTVLRVFNNKRPIKFGGSGEAVDGDPIGSPTSALSADTALIRGIATGTYKYLDEDPDLKPGKTYFYRVRAFFGDATDYLALTSPDPVLASNAGLVQSGNSQIMRYAPKLNLSNPSRTVKAFVPRVSDDTAFQAYTNVYDAIVAGLLLNFDLPPATAGDTLFQQDQKTGWGTLGIVAGQMGAAKLIGSKTFPDSPGVPPFLNLAPSDFLKASVGDTSIGQNVLFSSTARRLANMVVEKLYQNPTFTDVLVNQWNSGVSEVVNRIIDEQTIWYVPAIVGGITPEQARSINFYLDLEDGSSGVVDADGKRNILGPIPLTPSEFSDFSVTVEERLDLANFIRSALSVVSAQTGYLSWYSVTVGDLFPALTPFIFDFEQFLLALLKAINSALEELKDIIETLLQKVRALKQIIETILALLELLNVNVAVSVLSTSTTNGSADSLVQDLIQSQNKPGSSPYGLHSGMVLTAGGPGEGFIAAIKTIKYILTIPS